MAFSSKSKSLENDLEDGGFESEISLSKSLRNFNDISIGTRP